MATYIVGGIFVVIIAVLSMRQRNSNRGKSLEQRREEVYDRYVGRIEEFKVPDEGEDACVGSSSDGAPEGSVFQDEGEEAGE